MKLDRNATVAEVYAHPLGRDIIDKMLLQTGRSATWVCNPLISRLRLRQLDTILGRMFGPGFVDTLVDLLADCPDSPPRLDGPVSATETGRVLPDLSTFLRGQQRRRHR